MSGEKVHQKEEVTEIGYLRSDVSLHLVYRSIRIFCVFVNLYNKNIHTHTHPNPLSTPQLTTFMKTTSSCKASTLLFAVMLYQNYSSFSFCIKSR